MSPQQLPFPVIKKLGKTEMTLHVKEDRLEPLREDLTHLLVSTTLGTSQPLVQLNTLLGLPLVTGRLVGGMKAPPEGTLVGPGTLNPIHRTPGTKTRDSAKVAQWLVPFFKLQLHPNLSICARLSPYPSWFSFFFSNCILVLLTLE